MRTVPKSGGTPTTLAEVDRQVNDLVADDEAVFLSVGACSTWPSNGCPDWTDSIVRVSKSTGARQVLASGSGQLALDDEWVYYQFLPTSAGRPRPPGEIRRVPKAGGPYEALVRFENLDLPALTVFGDTVYWSASEQRDGNGALHAAPKNGGNPVTLVSNNAAYYMRMKADFDFLYLRWFANGSVFRVRRNGTDGKWIRGLDGQSSRDDIDANAGVVYWNEGRNMEHPGCLGRANSDGSGVRCLDQGDFDLRAVRVDDTAVYYVKNGEIWRILK